MLAYIAQVSAIFLICSGIFWSITCASIAVGSNLKNPLKHLLTGALLQFVGFVIVGIIGLSARRKAREKQSNYQNLVPYQSAQVDEW